MKNQDIIAGIQDAYWAAWKLGAAEVSILDYKLSKPGAVRFLVDSDPRAALKLDFGPPDIKIEDYGVIGIKFHGCEIVWREQNQPGGEAL